MADETKTLGNIATPITDALVAALDEGERGAEALRLIREMQGAVIQETHGSVDFKAQVVRSVHDEGMPDEQCWSVTGLDRDANRRHRVAETCERSERGARAVAAIINFDAGGGE